MIIKQDNGLFCVFSTVEDVFISVDQTREELIQQAGEEAKQQAEKETAQLIDEINAGGKPYHQFGVTYEQAMQRFTCRQFGKNYERLLKDNK